MFKVLTKGCEPERATKYSACVDVFSAKDVVIGAGETVIVGLGIAIREIALKNIAIHHYKMGLHFHREDEVFKKFIARHYISLKPRSSLRAKGLISHSAVIDLDYTQELKMIIHNPIMYIEKDEYHIDLDIYGAVDKYKARDLRYTRDYEIRKGDKVGQITLMEHKGYLMGYESDVKRTGGIGSTGR